MTTLTLELDSDLVHEIEDSARRESKTASAWAAERLKVAAMEASAVGNGYPPGWLKLFGAIPDSDNFEAPRRGASRSVDLDADV